MTVVNYIENAQKKIIMDTFNGDKTEAQAVSDLNGMLLVLDEVADSKAPKLKEEAAKLRASINANIEKLGGAITVVTE